MIKKSKESRRHTYINKDSKILVAVSGWPDSMYLLSLLKDFFKQQKYPSKNLHIISCDHGTRPEIKKEMTTVKNFSSPHPRKSIQYQGKKTTEDALRQRRHQEFIHYAKKENIWLLFLGHHLDDRIETTILSLQQWCGYKGFCGMKRYEKHFLDETISIVRPLLSSYSKEEILKECEKKHIPYHIDPSNNDIYTSQRNSIRKYISILSNDTKFKKSWQKVYNHIDKKEEKISKTSNAYMLLWHHYRPSYEEDTRILDIDPMSRNDELLYLLYQKHHITIRPRGKTLSRLAEQLQNINASITYQWISIQTKKYISIIKIKKGNFNK